MRKALLLVIIIWLSNSSLGQSSKMWLMYGKAQYLHSLGLEADIILHRKVGIHFGAGSYYQKYDPNRVINAEYGDKMGFYNANLGASLSVWQKNENSITLNLGGMMYFGPDYEPFYYYAKGEYYIYYDSSRYIPDYGVDLGISYTHKRFSSIIKFDTARNKFRFGIGFTFKNKEKTKT